MPIAFQAYVYWTTLVVINFCRDEATTAQLRFPEHTSINQNSTTSAYVLEEKNYKLTKLVTTDLLASNLLRYYYFLTNRTLNVLGATERSKTGNTYTCC